jgi:hypothetical protein
LIWEIAQNTPAVFYGKPSQFMSFLMGYCIDDESRDFEVLLDLIFNQLPVQVPNTLENYLWAIGRGYYVRGIRALIWDRRDDAEKYFKKGRELNFQFDNAFVQQATHELLGYSMVFAADASLGVVEKFLPIFKKYLGNAGAKWILGSFLVNIAEQYYSQGELNKIPACLMRAFYWHPKYLFDRGVISLFLKSLFRITGTRASSDH